MRFEYLEPESIAEALQMLTRHQGKAKVLAGGTDLMLQMRYKQVQPETVIDITRIPGLDSVAIDGREGLRMGALTTIRAVETSAQIRESYPILSQAAGQLGSVAIRNVATVGGNLCNALPSAEMPQVLLAHSARVRTTGPRGERVLPLEDFLVGVGKTVLQPDELLVEISVPEPAPHTLGIYVKHSPRGQIDLAIINVTVLITMEPDGRRCREARIVLGAVSPTPVRARKAEGVLKGKKIDEARIDETARAASEEANPRRGSIRGSFEYKKEMVRVLTGRAIRALFGSSGIGGEERHEEGP